MRKLLILSFLLLISSIAHSQTYLGVNGNYFLDGTKSLGGSIEIGIPKFGGIFFLQASYINRNYNQTFPGGLAILNGNNYFKDVIGDDYVAFNSEQEFEGHVYAAGEYSARTWIDYLTDGSQLGLSGVYCYPVFPWMLLGPGVGIVYQTLHAVPAESIGPQSGAGGMPTVYGVGVPDGSIESDPEGRIYDTNTGVSNIKRQFAINFGAYIKIEAFGENLVSLGYMTQTGASLGVDIKI